MDPQQWFLQFLHLLLVLGSIPTFASVYTGATGNCCSCSCCLFHAVSVKTAFNAVAVDLTFLLMLWLLLLPSLLLLYLFSNFLFLLSCCLFLPFYGFFLSLGILWSMKSLNKDPGPDPGQIITDPDGFGSGSYLDFFVVIDKNMVSNWGSKSLNITNCRSFCLTFFEVFDK